MFYVGDRFVDAWGRDVEPETTDDTPYSKMKVEDLKALAESYEIDLAGVTKKSELVALLEQHDVANQS